MHALGPAAPELLRQRTPAELEPAIVDERAEGVRARRPDQHRGAVRHRAEALLALAQGRLGALVLQGARGQTLAHLPERAGQPGDLGDTAAAEPGIAHAVRQPP